MLYVACILIANQAEQKILQFGNFILPGGTIIFCFSMLLADIITEVFKFKKMMAAVWGAVSCNFIWSFYMMFILEAPYPSYWENQRAFELIVGLSWLTFFVSNISLILGDYTNAKILLKIRLLTRGKYFWLRCIASTFIAHFVGGLVFFPLGFFTDAGIGTLIWLFFCDLGTKTCFSIVGYPLQRSILYFLEKYGAYSIDEFSVSTAKTNHLRVVNNSL